MPKSKIEPDIFDIDQCRLDQEWIMQPALFFRYAENLANAKRELEEEKAELDLTRAEVALEIRNHPEDYDLPKVTEASIAATVISQPEYELQHKKVIKAKHTVDVMQAAVTALDHRKRALEKLVDLHGQSYFATPQTSNEKAKEAINTAKKRQARRRRKE